MADTDGVKLKDIYLNKKTETTNKNTGITETLKGSIITLKLNQKPKLHEIKNKVFLLNMNKMPLSTF